MKLDAHDVTPPAIAALLERAGFTWTEPGYWSVKIPAPSYDAYDVELALEPQVLNAGDWKLSLYVDGEQQLDVEVLVDVNPRPSAVV